MFNGKKRFIKFQHEDKLKTSLRRTKKKIVESLFLILQEVFLEKFLFGKFIAVEFKNYLFVFQFHFLLNVCKILI